MTNLQEAVDAFWLSKNIQRTSNKDNDVGMRSSVTAGKHMSGIENLIIQTLVDAGVPSKKIFSQSALELPGYFRPEKKWDLLIVDDSQLICAIELKSQAGSFGNNFNNRVEEALGSAVDIWTAYREGRLGARRPYLGYFFLLEDCPEVHGSTKSREPHFSVDPALRSLSYCGRYEFLCRRLILERLYDTSCLTLSTSVAPHKISHPCDDLNFTHFINDIVSFTVKNFKLKI